MKKILLILPLLILGQVAQAEIYSIKGDCVYSSNGSTFPLKPEDDTNAPHVVAMGYDNRTGIRSYAAFQDDQFVFVIQTSKFASLSSVPKEVFLSGKMVQIAQADANNANSMLTCSIKKLN